MATALTIDELPRGSRDLYTVELPDGHVTGIGTPDELIGLAEGGIFHALASDPRFRLEWAS